MKNFLLKFFVLTNLLLLFNNLNYIYTGVRTDIFINGKNCPEICFGSEKKIYKYDDKTAFILYHDNDIEAQIAFMREAKILLRLDHPNIIKLINTKKINSFLESHSKNWEIWRKGLYFFEELGNSDLKNYINTRKLQNLKTKLKILSPIVSAIAYLHKLNIIHGDLKTENVVLFFKKNIVKPDSFKSEYKSDSYEYEATSNSSEENKIPICKLIDFSHSLKLKDNGTVDSMVFFGTDTSLSPQLLKQFSSNSIKYPPYIYTKKDDIYALGFLIHEVMHQENITRIFCEKYGLRKFDFETYKKKIRGKKMLCFRTKKGWRPPLPYLNEDSSSNPNSVLNGLIEMCLENNPQKRPTAKEILFRINWELNNL